MRLAWWLGAFGLLIGCSSEEPTNEALSSTASNEAISALNERGHRVSQGTGRGQSGVDGIFCALGSDRSEEMEAEDARLLSKVANLVEIRVLPNGGPPDKFWDALDVIESLRDFALHYGLTEKGVHSLSKFPNLESFTVWGGSNCDPPTSLSHLPPMPKLRILHFEEAEITTDDFRHLKAMCPVLEEFEYDYELLPEDIKILLSIPSLKTINVEGFEMENGKVVPTEECCRRTGFQARSFALQKPDTTVRARNPELRLLKGGSGDIRTKTEQAQDFGS